MLQDLISKNLGLVLELMIMLGGGLLMFDRMKKKVEVLETTTTRHESALTALAGVKEKLEEQDSHLENSDRLFVSHLQEIAPHKACLVEAAKGTDFSTSLAEMKRSIARVEGWVMALANKQGIKEPRANGID